MNKSAVVVVCCSVSFLLGIFVGWNIHILKLKNDKKKLDFYETKANNLREKLLQ